MGISLRKSLAPRRRAYKAAKTSGHGAWGTGSLSADAEIRNSLRVLRSKSRHLRENNPYAKNFFRLLKNNVVGPGGITLQNKALREDGKTVDKIANDKIHEGWTRWGKKGTCDVTGKLSFRDACKLFIETVACDGEALVRMIPGFANPFGFAIQFLEADHLDENLNRDLRNGHKIRMGIEYDGWDRPVRYWLLSNHPGDYAMPGSPAGQRYKPIPAAEIIHEYTIERARQGRGVPWAHTVLQRMEMEEGLEEAGLVAARAGASKMGFYIQKVMEAGEEELESQFDDDDGDFVDEVEPGVMGKLPYGWDYKAHDPAYPNGELDPFSKLMLRGGASGWGVSYFSLANDLEGVNYTSSRQGQLIDRDNWRDLQGFVIESFVERVFDNWLPFATLHGAVNLPAGKIDQFNRPTWRGRGWDWVDPLKDQTANDRALKGRTKTLAEVLAERGKTLEEHFEELERERTVAEGYGIDLDAIKDGGKKDGGQQK